MSQAKKMPADASQLVLWFQHLPQPVTFLVERKTADEALQTFQDHHLVTEDGGTAATVQVTPRVLRFKSYPDGSGYRSESIISLWQLRGVTVEYATLELAAAKAD